MSAESTRTPSIQKDMSWAVIGQVIYLLSQFGVLSALTWFGTLADVARFGLAVAITTPIIMFTNLGLRVSLATDAAGTFQPNEYFRTRFLSSIAAVPAMLVAGLFATVDDKAVAMTIIVGLAKVAESQSDICYGCYQRHSRMDLVARSLILRGPITTLLFVLLLWQTGSAAIALVSQFVCWSVVALLHDQPIAHRLSQAGKTLWDLRRMWLLARETIPLGFATMLARLANSAPRFVINAVLGLEALGLFTAVSYIWQAGMMAMQQATNSLSAHLSRMHHEGRHKPFWKLIGRYATLFAVGSLACMVASLLIGDVLLGIAFGPKYRDGDQLLALVFLVMALQSAAVVCEMGMLAQRQFKTFARMRAVLVVAAFALSAAGARLDGIIGVGWGLVAVSAMQLLGAVWMLRRGQSLAPVTAGRQ